MSAKRFRAAALAGLLMLTGCPTPPTAPPEDGWVTPDEVLAAVRARDALARSLATEARVSSYSDQGARKGKMVIVARRPASVHFSAMSPTDDLVAVLVSDGARFTAFERGGDVCHVGKSCPENVGRLLPLRMHDDEVVGLLLGGAPIIAYEDASVAWDGRSDTYRLTVRASSPEGDLVQDLWVAPKTAQVARTRLTQGGREVLSLEFADVRTVAGVPFPHRVHFRRKDGNVDMRITYRDIELNGAVSDDAFAIPCPEGTRIEELQCYDERPREEGATDG